MQKDNPTQFDALLRQFDANKIGNRLKNMSGAVAAMREIFGDMGKPNAPMSQLIEGLNALTQGGLATMNPAELERTVRTTQVIARTSGMGMQALTEPDGPGRRHGPERWAWTAASASRRPRVPPSSAPPTVRSVAATSPAGAGAAATSMTIMDQQLRLNAAASPMSNRLGAVMRIVRDPGRTPATRSTR